MTFAEWWKDCMSWTEYEPDQKEKALAKAAWEAGYLVGINDVPIAEYEPPEGYVLVPVEPAEAMVDEGEIAYVHGGTIEAVYKAMITAAQEGE